MIFTSPSLSFYQLALVYQVMEQTSDAEKAMSVHEFLDFKRKNKVHEHFIVIRHFQYIHVDACT